MAFAGAALRITQTGLRIVQLLCAIVVLGVYSYFLAVLSRHHLPMSNWDRAVEGMSGASVLYLFFAVFLTVCLGGVSFFAFFAVVLDVCFIGCYCAIAWFNRGGAGSCSGNVNTVLGNGPASSSAVGFGFGSGQNGNYTPNLHRTCRLETAVFAVSIINIFLFLITAVVQIALVRNHRREKRYGPSPANNYTSGSGRFWRRNRTRKGNNTRDAEMATAGNGIGRHSNETGYTGTTMEAPVTGGALDAKYAPHNAGVGYGNTNTGYVDSHVPVQGSRVTGTNY
jgi:hypothetical protein